MRIKENLRSGTIRFNSLLEENGSAKENEVEQAEK